MHINPTATMGLTSQPLSLAKADKADPPVLPRSEQKTVEADVAKEFYVYEEAPWLKMEVPEEWKHMPFVWQSPSMHLFLKTGDYISGIRNLYGEYKNFKADVLYQQPNLAEKQFTFTLDPDGKLKILDAQNKLTQVEKDELTYALNNYKDFKSKVHQHAKTTMALVDHDLRTFGGKIELNLSNFGKTIDYGKVLDGTFENLHDSLTQQILEGAERRSRPLIDIEA